MGQRQLPDRGVGTGGELDEDLGFEVLGCDRSRRLQPGASSHELGLSVDLADEAMLAVVEQIGWEHGWGRFEAPGEWRHVTYGG